MLNISHNKLHESIGIKQFKSGKKVLNRKSHTHFNRFLLIFGLITVFSMFLPWTQNISGRGQVTTLKPDQRPQTIQSPIPGRIETWFVQEGELVKKGDTILKISEVKSDYFDPNLVLRTEEQIQAKNRSANSYKGKVEALDRQILALRRERDLKLKQADNKLTQARLKVKSDSIDLEAATTKLDIANSQYNRVESLQEEGLKSVRDVEDMRLKLQEAQAKFISSENQLLMSKNEVINSQVELTRLGANYVDKISKAQSDMFAAQSGQFETEAQVSKLENAYSNYKIRNELQYITAPQDGIINKALKAGIGETFKEGEELVSIMPSQYQLAVETFVEPLDLPLIHIGEKVRVQFDGWPAIVFSGWPTLSYGTYGAEVVAIENYISENGKYRVLLSPDTNDHEWPYEVRVGSGARTIALLEDVPIWYEVWRQLNGFPPNFYQPLAEASAKEKS